MKPSVAVVVAAMSFVSSLAFAQEELPSDLKLLNALTGKTANEVQVQCQTMGGMPVLSTSGRVLNCNHREGVYFSVVLNTQGQVADATTYRPRLQKEALIAALGNETKTNQVATQVIDTWETAGSVIRLRSGANGAALSLNVTVTPSPAPVSIAQK